MGSSRFPWLSANIYREDGSLWMKPYVVLEAEGVRVGIVGVTTHVVPRWEEAAHIAGLRFEDALESAGKWLNRMRENERVDVAVLCYHGGFAHDLSTGIRLESDPDENQGYEMCRDLDFDVFITGHQHREICTKAFGKSIVQPGTKGVCAAAVTLEIEMDGEVVKSVRHKPELHDVDEGTPLDERIVREAAEIHALTGQWLDEPIGRIEGDMLYADAFDVRVNKHPYIEFIQRVQMRVSGAPISCTALFHDHPGGLGEQVTMRDIVINYIYPNTLKVLQVTGQQIYNALEQCASYFTIQDGQLAVDDSFTYPKAQPYNYDMWEGIAYVIDVRKPAGRRVASVAYEGKSLDPAGTYEVVMNSYRATGAGNFPYFADCPVLKEIQTDMTELIANYFLQHPVVKASCTRNWKVIWN